MGYRFIENRSIADVAIELTGRNVNEIFGYAAEALTNTMIKNTKSIDTNIQRRFELNEKSLELLLVDFIEKLIFYKDVQGLIFRKVSVDVKHEFNEWIAGCFAEGERLDPKKHEFLVDVKAATMHMLKLEENKNEWVASIVLDV